MHLHWRSKSILRESWRWGICMYKYMHVFVCLRVPRYPISLTTPTSIFVAKSRRFNGTWRNWIKSRIRWRSRFVHLIGVSFVLAYVSIPWDQEMSFPLCCLPKAIKKKFTWLYIKFCSPYALESSRGSFVYMHVCMCLLLIPDLLLLLLLLVLLEIFQAELREKQFFLLSYATRQLLQSLEGKWAGCFIPITCLLHLLSCSSWTCTAEETAEDAKMT